MALKLSVERKKTIEVICHLDSAIGSPEKYPEYLDSFGEENGPHEDLLNLVEGETPTRFVLLRLLPFQRKQEIRGKNFRVREGDVEMNVNYMTDTVRSALVDVKNPPSVAEEHRINLKRGKDGLVDGDVMNTLEAAGVLKDLISAHQAANSVDEKGNAETKNS